MRNKIKLIFLFLIIISCVLNSDFVFAGSVTELLDKTGYSAQYSNAEEHINFPLVVGKIIKAFLSLLGMIFIGLIIYSGFMWMTARGDSEQVNKAKDTLKDAIIGLIIVLASYVITEFIVSAIVKSVAETSTTGY